MLDVSTASVPVQVGLYPAWGMARGLALDGDRVFVADHTRGLTLLRSAPAFADVTGGNWAYDAIRACYRADIVVGYWDGTYNPASPVTRDQMAVFISRALAGGDEYVPAGPATATFSDVTTGNWAYKYIEHALAEGVVSGYGDGTYRPALTVNRAEVAVFVARAMTGGDAGVPEDPDGTAFFPDVPETHWACKHVEYCHDQGVASGYWDGYHPDEAVNRAQVAVYVARAFALPM